MLYKMEVTVNQEILEIQDNCSIAMLLDQLPHLPAKGIAVALNQQIVAKTEWSDRNLVPGDKVMIIKATQGG